MLTAAAPVHPENSISSPGCQMVVKSIVGSVVAMTAGLSADNVRLAGEQMADLRVVHWTLLEISIFVATAG